jgi:hypothetical protein
MDEIYHKSRICANPHNEITTFVQMKNNLNVERVRCCKRASILSQWYNHHLFEKVATDHSIE